ncbi:MAG: hypothetical protein HS111_10060 [Kofleriaceae bacterium]|nr:hypothetical protein [Kofleriaceae bacterium]
MTVKELIELLQEQDENAEVRLAHQPTYPMEYSLKGIASSLDLDECLEPADEVNAVVYLVEGAWLGHGRRDVWDAAYR